MQTQLDFQAIKQVDPIWKRIRVDRINALLLFVFLVAYIYFVFSNYVKGGNIGLALFGAMYIFYYGLAIYRHIQAERYWTQLGWRRVQALQSAQTPQATPQPSYEGQTLTLPLTLRLRWNRTLLSVLGGFGLLLVVGLLAIPAIMLAQHNPSAGELFIAFGILIGILVLFLVYAYFASFRYQPQIIEVTEEGIKTRYMCQERFLRWDEARLFARYGAQGLRKTSLVSTFELSNEHTVVRWSNILTTNFLLTLESNVSKREDWNWLIGQLNTLVETRTGLSQLNLNDQAPQAQFAYPTSSFSFKRSFAPPSQAPSTPTVSIAKDDPVIQRTRLSGDVGKSLLFLASIAAADVLLGITSKFSDGTGGVGGFFSTGFGTFLIVAGGLMLLLLLFLFWMISLSRKFWGHIVTQREAALQRPEQFRVQTAAHAQTQLPQPTSIRISTRRRRLFFIAFVTYLIVCEFFALLFHFPGESWQIALLAGVVGALLLTALLLPLIKRSNGQRIEVTPTGIATRSAGNVESFVRWEDVRLFACYKPLQLIKRPTQTRLYELDSEKTVVRWQWPRAHLQRLTLEPAMSPETYAQWLQQLQDYASTRTQLPLVDLDRATQ